MPNNTPKQPTHNEWEERIKKILIKLDTGGYLGQDGTNGAMQAINAAVLELVVGEDEDLNAPLNREIDDNPETDKYPLLYVVRRAVRNVFRARQRQAITGKSNQL